MIRLKRAYDPPEAREGSRFLVSILLETFGSLYFGIRNIATGLRNGYVEMKFL